MGFSLIPSMPHEQFCWFQRHPGDMAERENIAEQSVWGARFCEKDESLEEVVQSLLDERTAYWDEPIQYSTTQYNGSPQSLQTPQPREERPASNQLGRNQAEIKTGRLIRKLSQPSRHLALQLCLM